MKHHDGTIIWCIFYMKMFAVNGMWLMIWSENDAVSLLDGKSVDIARGEHDIDACLLSHTIEKITVET